MNGPGKASRNHRARETEFVAAEEFCAMFEQNMSEFYSLALWLTSEHSVAEECFLDALAQCRTNTGVFKPWAASWSRLAVIQSAIRKTRPAVSDRPFGQSVSAVPGGVHAGAIPVLRLRPFERFVYVLSILDRYSSRDCAILLKCRPKDVDRARWAALQSIAEITMADAKKAGEAESATSLTKSRPAAAA